MNRVGEDPLREGRDRPTADVQIPSGMTGKAPAHLRRTTMAAMAALATGASTQWQHPAPAWKPAPAGSQS